MPWVPFTDEDVRIHLASLEVDDYEDVGKMEPGGVIPSVADRLPVIASQVLARFRGNIRANPRVTSLGPAGTIPDFCVFSACVIARAGLFAVPPTEIGNTNPRQKAVDVAEDELKSLRTMSPAAFEIEEPAPPAPPYSGSFGGQPLLYF